MAYADPQLVHLDEVLTAISVGYRNADLVGEQLAPVVRVPKQSNKYNVFERAGFRVLDDIRAPKAKANEIPPRKFSRDSYFCEEHSLVDMVPVEESENADPDVDDAGATTEELTDTILINREDAIQTLVRTAANYATGHSTTLSGTAQWNDYTNSNPITDLKVARDKVFSAIQRMPNTVVMGYEVGSKLEDHPKFLDRIKSGIAESTDEFIMRLTSLGRIIRGVGMKDTSAVGQAESLAYLWGKDVVVAYVPPNPGRRVPSFMYEFVFPYQTGDVMPTERWFDNDHKSDKVRVSRRYDLKAIAVDTVASGKFIAGYVIKAAIA